MKGFLWLLVTALILGGGLGSAFAGGLALGKSQGGAKAAPDLTAQATPKAGEQSPERAGADRPGQSRQRPAAGGSQLGASDRPGQLRQRPAVGESQSGEPDRPQEQAPGGRGEGGHGFLSRGRVGGTIEKVEGSTVTVETIQGLLRIDIGPSTAMRRFAEGSLADLRPGLRVLVAGQRGEEGAVLANSVLVIGEGESGIGGWWPGRGAPSKPKEGQY